MNGLVDLQGRALLTVLIRAEPDAEVIPVEAGIDTGFTGELVMPRSQIERLGLKSDIIFTGYVPFEDLPAIYTMAEVMAFPSLYEGFGLPVIEAMACGTPVVTSNTSSLVEVADNAALLVDPLSVEELETLLRQIKKQQK